MAINEQNYAGFALSSTTGKPHRIRHLPKMAEWEPGVYMYETGDKFVAGIDGIDNLPAQQLANRTEFLKEQNALLAEACKGLVAVVRETTVGRTAINGYHVALSSDRPDKDCAWVKSQDNLDDAETYFLIEDKEGNAWQNPVAKIVAEEGAYCYVGGKGDSFPRIITVIGTVDLAISRTDLMQGGAWVRPSEDIGQMVGSSAKAVTKEGEVISNPTMRVVSDTDDAYYVRAYAPDNDPVYDEVVDVSGFEIATHGDIDAMLAR